MPAVEMFIKKLTIKPVNTEKGVTDKYNIIGKIGTEEKWYDSFKNEWNQDWKEGMTVKLAPEQFQSREYNGKTYWNIVPFTAKAKEKAEQKASQDAIMKKLDEISSKLDELIAIKTFNP